MSGEVDGGVVAILLNPPRGRELQETTTHRAVAAAAGVLGSRIVRHRQPLADRDARPPGHQSRGDRSSSLACLPSITMEHRLRDAGSIVAGWGMGGISGPARRHYRAQVNWLLELFYSQGHMDVWTVGGAPRHPSRWRQFTGPSRGHAVGDTFEERLPERYDPSPSRRFARGDARPWSDSYWGPERSRARCRTLAIGSVRSVLGRGVARGSAGAVSLDV